MFTSILRKHKNIKEDLRIYKERKLLEIDRDIENYRVEKQNEVTDVARICHEDLANYEHDFHHTKELRGIELAKLESRIEGLHDIIKSRKEVVKADQNLVNSLQGQIKQLNETIKALIENQPIPTLNVIKSK